MKKMHILPYCIFILLSIIISNAAPVKRSNGCNYAVKKFEKTIVDCIEYDDYHRHAI